jgi:hypothetical protein
MYKIHGALFLPAIFWSATTNFPPVTETGICADSYATLALNTLRSRLCCWLHNTPQLAPAGIFTEAYNHLHFFFD